MKKLSEIILESSKLDNAYDPSEVSCIMDVKDESIKQYIYPVVEFHFEFLKEWDMTWLEYSSYRGKFILPKLVKYSILNDFYFTAILHDGKFFPFDFYRLKEYNIDNNKSKTHNIKIISFGDSGEVDSGVFIFNNHG